MASLNQGHRELKNLAEESRNKDDEPAERRHQFDD